METNFYEKATILNTVEAKWLMEKQTLNFMSWVPVGGSFQSFDEKSSREFYMRSPTVPERYMYTHNTPFSSTAISLSLWLGIP